MVMAAVPVFWLGMMLAILFALHLGWLPASGVGSWKSYILPMMTLGIPYSARILRSTRTYMLEAVRQEFVRTARAKGVPERVVIWKHALANACLPIINTIGVYIGSLLGGAVVTETVFGINGLGTFIINSVKRKDIPAVTGGTVFLAIIFALILLTVDILYAVVDPRIRARFAKKG
jgi:peptide/nickel transport system permease protein